MITILAFIFVLSLLVFVHEFGHFAVAKISGIGVERFSLGLPPKLIGIKWGETEYCISAIPFGGYVKLTGQDDFSGEGEADELTPKDFRGKSAPVRIAVLAAGSLMNLLTAIVIFSLLFWNQGIPETNNRIGFVTENSIAAELGFRAGDEIIGFNGKPLEKLEELFIGLYTREPNTFTVLSAEGETREIIIDRKLEQGEDLGVLPYIDARVEDVMESSAAKAAGLLKGDIIKEIDGQEVSGGWYHMSMLIRARPGELVDLTIQRGDSLIHLPVNVGSVMETDGSEQPIGRIGITPYIPREDVGFFGAVAIASERTWFFATHTLDFFGQLITGRMSSSLLGGPVMIAQLAGESARVGIVSLLEFTAFISINLGVLNLLPFPVLDGGHIFVALVESAVRRKLSPKVKNVLQSAGAFILIFFMLYVTFNDLMRFDAISRIFRN